MITLILLFSILLNFSAGLLVSRKENAGTASRLFASVSFFASLWTFMNYLCGAFHSVAALKASFAACTLLVAAGYVWVSYAIEGAAAFRRTRALGVFAIFCAGIAFVPSFIAVRIGAVYLGGVFSGAPSFGLYFYLALFAAAFVAMLAKLSTAIRRETEPLRRVQFRYAFLGVSALFFVASVADVVLPAFSIFKLAALPSIGFLLFLSCAGYSILRFDEFRPKVIAIDLAIFSLWAFTLAQIFALDTIEDQVLSLVLLAISVAVGVTLRRSVLSELRLGEELGAANAELSELSAQKTEFLAFATHQVQSPLAAIAGYAGMLTEGAAGPLTKKQGTIVQSMNDTALRLSATVNDFLALATIERGAMRYDMEHLEIGGLLAETVRDAERLASAKNIPISLKIPEGRLFVRGDRRKLRQAIGNLVDNAIKYAPDGRVDIMLERADGAVRIEVSDTGIGFDAETERHLFEKWRRSPDGRMIANGSGLGLYLAQEIARAHGGEIGARSAGLGTGATFYAVFPESELSGKEGIL